MVSRCFGWQGQVITAFVYREKWRLEMASVGTGNLHGNVLKSWLYLHLSYEFLWFHGEYWDSQHKQQAHSAALPGHATKKHHTYLSEILRKCQISVGVASQGRIIFCKLSTLAANSWAKVKTWILTDINFVDFQLLHIEPQQKQHPFTTNNKYVCLEQLTGFPACSAFASFASVATFAVSNNLGYTRRLSPTHENWGCVCKIQGAWNWGLLFQHACYHLSTTYNQGGSLSSRILSNSIISLSISV